MGKYNKPIEEIDECPNCGDNFGYYQKMYVSGWIQDIKTFDTREPYNSGQSDSFKYSRESKYYYCMECHGKIARVGNEC
jgi:hypothetical protein